MLLVTHLSGRSKVGGNVDVERVTVRYNIVLPEYRDVVDDTSLRTIDTSRRGNMDGERVAVRSKSSVQNAWGVIGNLTLRLIVIGRR
jgi:hypothetical protein